ncbi:hypothetical protein E4U14_006848 [Claviceps sp. LM454 group G7]|nr:hypothetical protein E4U14_006848 [Claviceps sp. LM454 group G7]
MVRILSIVITTLAAVSPVAQAGVCQSVSLVYNTVALLSRIMATTVPRACIGILYTSVIPMEV